ncbi:MAG: histidinol-phosphate transaminase [Clostridia bacterium]|nr:histidinol-phosphate transaminase [Clostridia bacterium]
MSKFISARLKELEAYVPGEQPQTMRYIKLNTNESPFEPSPEVKAAVTSGRAASLQLYPEPDCTELSDALAGRYGVGRENIVLGNGSDEILNFCFAAYFDRLSPVIFPDITYGFYKVFGDLYGSDYTQVPLDSGLRVNPDDYIGANKNIVLANPNAPTGIALGLSDIEKIVSSNPDNIVVIDEAYVDFGGESCVPLIKKYKNLIVVMTFSKSRSLAGARVGFAIADSGLAADLNKIKYSTNPYNINSMSQQAAKAALESDEYYSANCNRIIDNRNAFCRRLEKLGFDYLPSSANFVFARKSGVSGLELYTRLKENGILVRRFDNPRISDWLRITIGTKEQMETLAGALSGLTEEMK